MASSVVPLVAAAQRTSSRIPSLDGLRAFAIMAVLLGHMAGTRGLAHVDLGVGDYAHLGVVVFFAISGFLITDLLLRERNESGSVSLSRFYARRALRLFPAAFALIGVLWACGLINGRDLAYAATYTVNFFPERSWNIGHLWSLSVEEQFYLLWPVAFALVKPRYSWTMAVAWVVIGPATRLASWAFLAHTPYYQQPMFPLVADALAVGCLLAMFRRRLEAMPAYTLLFSRGASIGVAAAVLVLNRYMGYSVVWVFGTSILNVLVAILIHRAVARPNGVLGAVLNWQPVAVTGVLSYSLYLWQQIFLNRYSGEWMCAFPQNILLTVVVAGCSYFALERPLMSLRSRLHSVRPEPLAVRKAAA